ncbi:chorismate mutase [Salidesulfovibrio brasiliensis]|uniref:chorismate mutase n=1 Tax=Salidesulfovibrio brasiliensis TaxID=221711 RepID=UPI0006D2C1AF|nr:chorismate mutase [Salidesulfovibrio brasiliensis]
MSDNHFEDDDAQQRPAKSQRYHQISEIDSKILGLLEKRSYLLRKEGAWRRSKQKSQIDPQLEKDLRRAWEEAGEGLGLDPRLSRQLFTLANQFAQSATGSGDKGGYKLAPRREAADATIEGPRSLRTTRLWMSIAAACGQPCSLPQALLNAPNKDLAKGLKQAGAAVTWDDTGFSFAATEPLEFENAMLFAGDDPLNFYLLLCMALGNMGRCKFTGQATLQLLEVQKFNKFLPQLGARLVPMNPNNPGLPCRLESGGTMDEEITLPKDIDPDFAAALVLASWSYPGGLAVNGLSGDALEAAAAAADVLEACGIEVTRTKDGFEVSDGIPAVPETPVLPLDTVLTPYLLALPAFCGGRISVRGTWAESAKPILDQLADLGIEIEQTDEAMTATSKGIPSYPRITIGERAGLYPLALALGVRAGKAVIEGQPPMEAAEMLDHMNATYEADTESISITGVGEWEGSFGSPAPEWSLGLALAAWRCPGIMLSNHGELTSWWPQFWNFYNTLPTGVMKPKPKKEDRSVKRRRIRIG